jgi:hypothetical protein
MKEKRKNGSWSHMERSCHESIHNQKAPAKGDFMDLNANATLIYDAS